MESESVTTGTRRDYRDLTIESLTAEVLHLEADRDGARREVVIVRDMLSLALTQLHDAITKQRHAEERLRAIFDADVEQNRDAADE